MIGKTFGYWIKLLSFPLYSFRFNDEYFKSQDDCL